MKAVPKPESQVQEVLYELINRLFIDRKTMMLSSNVLNLTANISVLRSKGLNIKTNNILSTNKYNREVTFARYSLQNKKEAVKIYLQLKENQAV